MSLRVHWATAEQHKDAALQAAASIEALAAQHTWLAAENQGLSEQLRGVVEAGDALADAVTDILADDPESVLHTHARSWRVAREGDS